ncbi:hypothetical protein J1605_023254 [Eschrichtius robustus]|uniref:Uncharacterized protein n=1 Tax=Eschrichtius robustus TaxID=9764 RepID=A0AB34H5N1_ESCRO|nr:hypothetical protein J1605_023254 [Eschrichtius robustus]
MPVAKITGAMDGEKPLECKKCHQNPGLIVIRHALRAALPDPGWGRGVGLCPQGRFIERVALKQERGGCPPGEAEVIRAVSTASWRVGDVTEMGFVWRFVEVRLKAKEKVRSSARGSQPWWVPVPSNVKAQEET